MTTVSPATISLPSKLHVSTIIWRLVLAAQSYSHISLSIVYFTIQCILCVYYVYTLCIVCVYFVYTLCILCIIYFVCTLWIMCKLYCVYMRVILAAKSHSLISLSIVCWLLTAVVSTLRCNSSVDVYCAIYIILFVIFHLL